MCAERATAVVRFELAAEGLVLLHHVEDVAQHLEHDAVGLRAHGRRARIEAHARHLSEEIALTERGERIVVGEIDGCVNADVRGSVSTLFVALVRLQRHQLAAHLREEALRLAGGGDVRARAAQKDVGIAFEDVEGGRAVVAFADDDLSGSVVAADDCPCVQFKERSRDAFEDRQREQVFGLDGERFDGSGPFSSISC